MCSTFQGHSEARSKQCMLNRWVCLGRCLQEVANLADDNDQVNNEEVQWNGCLCACDKFKKTPTAALAEEPADGKL